MIKLIIFDLHGVLTESKEAHYQALNKALESFKFKPITYEEHVSTYDGLPTVQKLKLRHLSDEEIKKVNERKQEYTAELLDDSISKDEKLINLFKRLKEEGYFVHVASNSIRYTIQLVLYKKGIMKYVDYVVSNQEVTNSKPNPEMYLKCMIFAGVGPRNTLIVEDSYVGRQGVFNSGSNLCAVRNPNDLSYELIISSINKYNGVKQKWRGNKMNILIPMAGAGSRFVNAGYTFPKPLIEINKKPMIQAVIENINIDATYIYVVREEHYKEYNLKYLLEMITPNCEIVIIDKLTDGAACTTLLAKEYIDNDSELLIANSDQWIVWDSSDFMYSMQSSRIDGGVLTFQSTHPKWSYVKTDENGCIIEIVEKKVISDIATVGIYYWKRGNEYVKYAEQMIEKDIRVNGEFYVAPVYSEAIADNKKIKTYTVDKMYGLGTPEDLEIFLKEDVLNNED